MNPTDGHTDPRHTAAHPSDLGADPIIPGDHQPNDTHQRNVTGDPNLLNGHIPNDTQPTCAVEQHSPRPAKAAPIPIDGTSAGALDGSDQNRPDTQSAAVAAPSSSPPATHAAAPITCPPGVTSPTPPEPAIHRSQSNEYTPVLADPLLALAADVLDDLERVRIANENRLRQLTRDVTDKDGQERGFGLTLDHPDVARLAALVEALAKAEHDATLNLQRMVRRHPLGPWIKSARGVGEKQGARLLAAIGDPYIRPELTYPDGRVEPSRPRTVYELYAFCGYHVLPAGHSRSVNHIHGASGDPTSARHLPTDTQTGHAGGTQLPTGHTYSDAHEDGADGDLDGGNPDHTGIDAQCTDVGVAAARARGVRANWNPTARMRGRLIAESIIKAGGPYREIYNTGRAKYAGAVHRVECRRCGPAGKPAPTGSALSDGHKHARALRLVTKAILRDLWREAKRLHEQAPS